MIAVFTEHGYCLAVYSDDEAPEPWMYPGCQFVESDKYRAGMWVRPDEYWARQRKLSQLNAWLDQKHQIGFDTGLGWSLRTVREAQTSLAEYRVLLGGKVETGRRTLEDLIVLPDVNGNGHQVTIGQFFELLLDYGAYCEQLDNAYRYTRHAIDVATTVEEIEAVEMPA